ncbi:hypothetical protein VZT92_017036 [Zoarces viviparus]|uniref:Secreted protein n=1 Tax=Zoarces viviparus TaxID=48416 RepID=A0AAW1ERJ5_ZOAVI
MWLSIIIIIIIIIIGVGPPTPTCLRTKRGELSRLAALFGESKSGSHGFEVGQACHGPSRGPRMDSAGESLRVSPISMEIGRERLPQQTGSFTID